MRQEQCHTRILVVAAQHHVDLGTGVGVLFQLVGVVGVVGIVVELQDVAVPDERGLQVLVAVLQHIKHRLNLVDGRLRLLHNIANPGPCRRGPIGRVNGQNHLAGLARREIVRLHSENGGGLLLAGDGQQKCCHQKEINVSIHNNNFIFH